jgi:hypothetical protein
LLSQNKYWIVDASSDATLKDIRLALESFDSFEFVVENGHTIVKYRNSDFAIDLQG